MRSLWVLTFVMGFAAAVGAGSALFDYASGLERYSRWGKTGPPMALNTATVCLLLGIGLMSGGFAGLRLHDSSRRIRSFPA